MCKSKAFARDERGSVTLWMLVWIIMFIGFAGLAVDVANAYRVRSMLQATADSAAIAGALELGNGETAVDSAAQAMADRNMPYSPTNGSVVLAQDVTQGRWFQNPDTPSGWEFDPDSPIKNAVRVVAERADVEGKQPVSLSLLRVLNLPSWNVGAVAIAALDGGSCTGKSNRIVALQEVNMTSNNYFGGDLCVYGQVGIDGRMNNEAESSVIFGHGAVGGGNYGWTVKECNGCVAEPMEIPADEAGPLTQNIAGKISEVRSALFGAGPFNATSNPGGYVSLPDHQNGNKGQEAAFGQALANGAKRFWITCKNSNASFDLKKAANGLSLDGVTIYTGPTDGVDLESKSVIACPIDGPGLDVSNLTIASTNTEGGMASDKGGSSGSSTSKVSVKFNGQPSSVGGCTIVDGVATAKWEDGLRIFTLGGVNFTADADFETIQILAKKNVNYTAKAASTGALSIFTPESVTFTALANFNPGCPIVDPGSGTALGRLRLVL